MPRLRPVQKEEPKIVDNSTAEDQDNKKLEANTEENPVIVEEPVEQEDASAALQKQLDELKKSEELARQRAAQAEREREDAIKRSREREAEIARFQKEAVQSQADAISSGLAAAQAAAEKAQLDIENAIAVGDGAAQAKAYRALARAEADIARFEDGKVEIEAKLKEEPKPQTQAQEDPLDKTNLPPAAKNWLRAHPEYMQDQRKNSKIQALHWDVMDEGHEAFSPAYFESMEEKLGLRQKPQQQQTQQQQRNTTVSAPVSRTVPNGNSTTNQTKVTLTLAHKEAAKMAGITEEEYAKQLLKFNQARANGEIQ